MPAENRRYFRTTEVAHLRGDGGKARVPLRWRPTVDSAGLVRMMVDHDMDLARRERLPLDAGMEPEPRLSHVG